MGAVISHLRVDTLILGSETYECGYMDYIKFTKNMEEYDDWNRLNGKHSINDAWLDFGTTDRVHSPSHYTAGKQEVIDVIEDTIKNAPDVTRGMLQGQVMKYLMRLWLKDNPLEDAKKARWYLDRLISKMS